ncbi:MAG: hypothetical protein EPO28_09345 [Saprospiraceae bacterium]|nr:MAG: hypothetical protein EPO28_09345 [Saprospiraceae bacterium]
MEKTKQDKQLPEGQQSHLIRLLTATFDLLVRGNEIPAWRSAFVELAGLENDLFHNHDNRQQLKAVETEALVAAGNADEFGVPTAPNNGQQTTGKFFFRYPLIQYRSIKGKAAIFAMNEGVAAFQKVLATNSWEIEWEGQPLMLQLQSLDMKDHYLQMTKEMMAYQLNRWLPFNDENYQRWLDCPDLRARVDLLEKILSGQLLNFCTGAGWQLPERFDLRLLHLHATCLMRYHDTPRVALNVTYCTNMLLPQGIALGKAVSHGFGCQFPVRTS